jgi:MFS family permease
MSDEKASSPNKRFHPAWIAAAVTFLTLVVAAGFRSAPSVLIMPLEMAFGWSRSQVSFAISINILLFGLISPFAAALMEQFTVRKVVMSALATIGLGAFGTIFMTSPWHLDLLWGVVVGIGSGSMALIFAATVANRWFVKHRGLVVGALSAATSTGQLIFLPALSYLAVHHGWKSVSITVASGAFLMIPLVYVFLRERPSAIGLLPFGAPIDWQAPPTSNMNAGRLAIATLRESVHKKNFWLLFGSFFVCGLSTNGLVGTHFIPACMDHGMMEVTAASLLALIGVFDIIGTLASGWLTDKYDPRKLLFAYYFLRGVSLFLLPSILFSSVHPSTMVFTIFYGLDWIATVPPTLILCREVLGIERATVVYGWVYASHQIGGSIAVLGAGIMRQQLGNYSLSFYIAGIACVATSFLVLMISKTMSPEELRS